MFDFEKLEVYQVAKSVVVDALNLLYTTDTVEGYVREEWKKVNMQILINLSEATSRMINSEKRHYITASRSAVFQCVALLDLSRELGQIPVEKAEALYERYEKVSKMLLGMYRSFSE